MNQCYTCRKGQLEMCGYYERHYRSGGGPVEDCPEYEAEEDLLEGQIGWKEADWIALREELVCPYCGQTQDTHEPDTVDSFCCCTECEKCGKEFWYSVQVKREYQSRRGD